MQAGKKASKRSALVGLRVRVVASFRPVRLRALRSGFIHVVSEGLRDASATGVEWVAPGDWNASPDPSWRLGGAPNKAHDDTLARSFWPRESAHDNRGPAGLAIDLGLDHAKGEFSHHHSKMHQLLLWDASLWANDVHSKPFVDIWMDCFS